MLKISIINVGHGDSIVIRFPNGKWGLVDCNIPNRKKGNRVLKFLLDNKPQNEPLSLICLTHFDHDHFKGLLEILEKYQDELNFFVDPGRIYVLAAKMISYDDEKDKDKRDELTRIYEIIDKRKRKI